MPVLGSKNALPVRRFSACPVGLFSVRIYTYILLGNPAPWDSLEIRSCRTN